MVLGGLALLLVELLVRHPLPRRQPREAPTSTPMPRLQHMPPAAPATPRTHTRNPLLLPRTREPREVRVSAAGGGGQRRTAGGRGRRAAGGGGSAARHRDRLARRACHLAAATTAKNPPRHFPTPSSTSQVPPLPPDAGRGRRASAAPARSAPPLLPPLLRSTPTPAFVAWANPYVVMVPAA